MNTFARTDRSTLGLWWWTVDRWTLAALILLMGVGALLVLAASPAVATHLKLDSFYLVRHHFALLVPAAILMLGISLMTPRGIRRLAVIGLIVALALTALTLVDGSEIKGARRWIDLIGLSILSGSHLDLVAAVTDHLRRIGVTAPIVVGGIIPPDDAARLRGMGVAAVYTPKDFELSRIVSELADLASPVS